MARLARGRSGFNNAVSATSHARTIAPEHFNHYHDGTGGIYSLAHGAALLDVASGLFLRADIDSDSRGERTMWLNQLDALKPDDLLVLDRGYPAHGLFALLLARQQAFCMRLSTDYCPQVREFVRSGRQRRAVIASWPCAP